MKKEERVKYYGEDRGKDYKGEYGIQGTVTVAVMQEIATRGGTRSVHYQ
jgi:hypothetical protein